MSVARRWPQLSLTVIVLIAAVIGGCQGPATSRMLKPGDSIHLDFTSGPSAHPQRTVVNIKVIESNWRHSVYPDTGDWNIFREDKVETKRLVKDKTIDVPWLVMQNLGTDSFNLPATQIVLLDQAGNPLGTMRDVDQYTRIHLAAGKTDTLCFAELLRYEYAGRLRRLDFVQYTDLGQKTLWSLDCKANY